MRALVLWCPDWPVTAAGFAAEEPVAVLQGGRVTVASAGARAAGVQLGLRRREAESRCPGLVVRTRDPAEEARAFEPVVVAIAAIAPEIEVTRPGLLTLDARGPGRYFGGEVALCHRVVAEASAAQPSDGAPPPRTGVAEGRFAAALAARRGTLVPDGENRAFLAPFPLSVLGRPELADLLHRLGIHTLGAFAELPGSSVLDRFGPDAARLQALARGAEGEPVHPGEIPEEQRAVTSFDPPVDRAETAAFAARSLADELVTNLARHGLACTRLRIEAETEHGESVSRRWRAHDVLGPEEMVERLRWQLDGWLSGTTGEPAPTAGLVRLVLTADEVVPSRGRQLGLWGGASDGDRRARAGLDRLRGMLGEGAVFTAALGGGRGPADRVTLVPWGEPRPAPPAASPWPGHHPLPAPALVHPDPVPADVRGADDHPVVVSARGRLSTEPARVSVDGGPWLAVHAWAGPWTADERWWDPRTRRRRARFQLLDEDRRAHLCLVEEGRWRIEATYD